MRYIQVYPKIFLLIISLLLISKNLKSQWFFSSKNEFTSTVIHNPVNIDGDPTEWKNITQTFINNKTLIGFLHNRDYLYMYFETSDPEISMQIMNFGFTVWFDPQAKERQIIGVQFPIIEMSPPPPRDGKPPTGEELEEYLKKRLNGIVLESPHNGVKKRYTLEEVEKYGIKVAITVLDGIVRYELQYPLMGNSTQLTGLGLSQLNPISVCIETPKVNFDKIMEKFGDSKEEQLQMQNEPERMENDPDETSRRKIKPRPPKITQISEWIEVNF